MKSIKHIWFDLDGTLCVHTLEFHRDHDKLRYETYAKAIKQAMTSEVIQEYEDLYKKHGSNSAVFRSLGLPADYWMSAFNTLDKNDYYTPLPEIYGTLEQLKTIVPISLFTNDSAIGTAKTLQVINVDKKWFTHVITGDDVNERKPHLEGFRMVIDKSGVPAEEILYVGDRIDVDVKPAKQLGMKTCLVYSESNEADYSLLRFEDLLGLVS